MPDQLINRRDLDIILEVNKKSIEIETEVANQNEEIIELLKENIENTRVLDQKILAMEKENTKKWEQTIDGQHNIIINTKDAVAIEKTMETNIKESTAKLEFGLKELEKDIFQLKILFSAGVLSVIAQFIQIFLKK